MSENKFCPKCGSKLEANVESCPSCGFLLSEIKENSSDSLPQISSTTPLSTQHSIDKSNNQRESNNSIKNDRIENVSKPVIFTDLKQRNIYWKVPLSICTIDIYALRWMFKLTDESSILAGKRLFPPNKKILLYMVISLGFYYWYWAYKMGEIIHLAKTRRGISTEGNKYGTLFAILGTGPLMFSIGLSLIQSKFNYLIRYDTYNKNLNEILSSYKSSF